MTEIAFASHRLRMARDREIFRTIRRGRRDWGLGPAVLYDPEEPEDTLNITIWSVQYIRLGNVPPLIYGCEFKTREGLIEGMQEIYPGLTEDDEVTVARWNLRVPGDV